MTMSVLDPALCEMRSGLVLFEVVVFDYCDDRHMPDQKPCVR